MDGPLVEGDGGVSVETLARILERARDAGEAQDEVAQVPDDAQELLDGFDGGGHGEVADVCDLRCVQLMIPSLMTCPRIRILRLLRSSLRALLRMLHSTNLLKTRSRWTQCTGSVGERTTRLATE